MRTRRTRFPLLAVSVVVLLWSALPQAAANADPNPPVESFTYTPNMEPLGWEPRPNPASGVYNSDLAFWGDRAYQGTYDGFQIIDISNPEDPQQVLDYTQCTGTSASNQGDLLVWGNILMRSWNSNAGSGLTCDGQAVPSGFEGIHIFDISDETNPELLTFIDLPCGSHTATGFPDLANDRFIIYNDPSSGTCPQIDIIQVPLSNPAGAAFIRSEPSGRACHDTGVVLGDAMLAACAGGNGFTVWSIGGSRGGTFEDPLQLHSQTVSGVTIGHSHTFSWEGDILIFGHEPGGGSAARCQASSAQVDKTLFFYETETFTEVGQYILPRPQTSTENCTIHNFNVVPSAQRDILVHGSYQSGIGVVDFTDPTGPVEIAYADPAPLSPTTLILGGDWSTYWYNGIIYESDITRGLITWRLNDPAVAGAQTLPHLNPQTQEFTIRSLICPPIGEYADDFEPQADTGWVTDTALDANTPSDPWEVETDPVAHSASNSFATDAAGLNEKDDRLVAPPMDISSQTKLTFWHRFRTEASRDGGVLEVSTDGGGSWSAVPSAAFDGGGYNGTIDPGSGSRIAGRPAWTGDSPQPNVQTPVTVNLGAFAGQNVMVRWRYVGDPFRVGATPGVTWWVDDVSFIKLASNCRPIAVDDSATAINGIPVFVNVKANDLDPNPGDSLTVTDITQPAHGTAVLQPNQTVKYDPVCDFLGFDTFTYTISDGNGGTDVGLVSVRVRKTSRRGSFPC
jgi:hypothetical protein